MRVALVTESQHESLIDLLCELHTYYNAGSIPSRQIVREHLLGNLLAAGSPHRLAVASGDEGAVVGMAAITLVYSLVDFDADKRRHCQLKELYVRSSARSRGAGKALMAWVAHHAWEHGCRRIATRAEETGHLMDHDPRTNRRPGSMTDPRALVIDPKTGQAFGLTLAPACSAEPTP